MDVVLLYATVPVRRVLAEFDVCSVISESLQALWRRTKRFAGISEDFFFQYFQGREYGHAIEIGEVRPYKSPFCPIEHLGIRPPQSFVYVNFEFTIETAASLVGVLPTTHRDSPSLPGIDHFRPACHMGEKNQRGSHRKGVGLKEEI